MSAALRSDLRLIADFIPSGSRVLDIGCGAGELLAWLVRERGVDARGLEMNQQQVSHCVAAGLSVVQGDAGQDLSYYPDQSYDYVILSRTLQAMQDPRAVLAELVRIGQHTIVSVPNFAYWKNRLYLTLRGRMPVTQTLVHEWYNTPNIHFCTLRDLRLLCEEMGIIIERCINMTHRGEASWFSGSNRLSNLLAEQGVFMLRQSGGSRHAPHVT